ncbi:hypothetical protein METHB2_850003 [Candidatus Methylobacter favarea]|uniref:Uncharacterized protein n=1 Tax=Candidatus Methylobacter favarea TaxID=2707345 RepID=A0A8S0Y745_9GAMM|nr:hypothetical protein METHB2_850003 [Candidatus Methylobacter favarea]
MRSGGKAMACFFAMALGERSKFGLNELLDLGRKRFMVQNGAGRHRIVEGNGLEVLCRHMRQRKRWLRSEAEARVVTRLAKDDASCRAQPTQFRQRVPHEFRANPVPLALRCHRDGSETVPTLRATRDGYGRHRDMPNDRAIVICNKRDS